MSYLLFFEGLFSARAWPIGMGGHGCGLQVGRCLHTMIVSGAILRASEVWGAGCQRLVFYGCGLQLGRVRA